MNKYDRDYFAINVTRSGGTFGKTSVCLNELLNADEGKDGGDEHGRKH